MTNSFVTFLESMTIAMEAEDITQATANEVRSVLGEAPSTQPDAPENRDLMKVDDIFGTEKPQDGPSGNPKEDKDEGSENLPSLEDEPIEGLDDSKLKDQSSENPLQETPEEDTPPNEDLIFTSKNRIRDNLVQLYSIVTGNIEVIVNSLTSINDTNTIQVMNAVLNHLRNCKDYTYKTLTQNLNTLSYDELLQRYITLKRVYDICAQMMEKHFKLDTKNS